MAEDPPRTPDGGVLGNLPHSRPGRRSEKRDAGRPAEAAGAAAEKAEAVDSAAAKTPRPKRAARPRTPAAARPKRPQAPPAPPPPEPRSRGPVEEAVHLAGRIAGTGVRVAGGVTKEVLRRLPRP
jgi:hypothetical protein